MESLLSDAVVTDLYPVCDYWQLVTDGPVITINNPIEISYMNKVYLPYEIDKSLITGRRITGEKYIENVLYELVLENTLRIKISLCLMTMFVQKRFVFLIQILGALWFSKDEKHGYK